MYDRTTYLVVIPCALILGASVYLNSKNQQTLANQQPNPASVTSPATPAASTNTAATTPTTPVAPAAATTTATLETPEATFRFTSLGAGIQDVTFKNQSNVGKDTTPVVLNHFSTTPLLSLYSPSKLAETTNYLLNQEKSQPGKSLVFLGTLPSGLIVEKTYSLVDPATKGAPYLLNVSIRLQNVGQTELNLNSFSLFLGEKTPLYQKEWSSQTNFFWHHDTTFTAENVTAFHGGWFSKEKSEITQTTEHLNYAGVSNQFFTTVLRPESPQANATIWGRTSKITLPGETTPVDSITAGLSFPNQVLQPKQEKQFDYQLFVGPKNNTLLRSMGSNWGEIMEYNLYGIAANPLNYALNWLHKLFVHISPTWAWGWAIIALTLLVRTAIWPLYAKSARSMKRMSKLQPEMQKLKEKYSSDPQKMNQEVMKMYQTYGVNPLGGCLPMLIQMPIFFGFYRMLQYAVELRHQPFLWVHDLSQPDTLFHISNFPINILPIVMGLTSVVQMSMMPKQGDPMQRRLMMFMPLLFLVFCYNFASALALYWTISNLFSILQTFLTNRMPEPELVAKKPSGKKSWMEKLAEKQKEVERQRQTQSRNSK